MPNPGCFGPRVLGREREQPTGLVVGRYGGRDDRQFSLEVLKLLISLLAQLVVCVLLGQTVLGVINGEVAILNSIVKFIVDHRNLSALDG